MKRANRLSGLLLLVFLLATLTSCTPHRNFQELYGEDCKCYNRKREPWTSKVDTHCHFRPFGGLVIPFPELIGYFQRSGVRFVNAYGIGQTLPSNDTCTYYLDCPGTAVTPSLRNDFVNAAHFLQYQGPESRASDDPFEGADKIHLLLSLTYPDLAKPERIMDHLHLMDDEFPGLFKWSGEVNLVKQALFQNKQPGAGLENIPQWRPYMDSLRARDMPICIHSDLGNDAEPTKYLYLFRETLKTYKKNKIVWAHMGLSKELKNISPEDHIAILQELLDEYPKLMLDISWTVLWDQVFSDLDKRAAYVEFINANPTRFLPGTDFVASRKGKTYKTYLSELRKTSLINKYINDEAFRGIALGENYFRYLNLPYHAPDICTGKK